MNRIAITTAAAALAAFALAGTGAQANQTVSGITETQEAGTYRDENFFVFGHRGEAQQKRAQRSQGERRWFVNPAFDGHQVAAMTRPMIETYRDENGTTSLKVR